MTDWGECPLGTRAYAVNGGWWERVPRGWKWCTGDTFPRPGADTVRVELPPEPATGPRHVRDIADG